MSTIQHTCPRSEHSPEFIIGMLRRMEVSFHKYGFVKDAYPKKIDALESLQQRLQKYRDTGNTEWLIDAANFAMIEFMRPSIPDAKFTPTDSNASPGRIALVSGRATKIANKE